MTSAGGGGPGGSVGEAYRQQVLVGPGGLANVVQHGDQHIHQHIHQGRPAYQIEPFPLTGPAPDPAWLLEQPSRLLDARSQVVGFTGRAQELQHLLGWRDAPRAALSVLLLHGPGGQGKTRLAIRFAQLSSRAGWTVLQARYDAAQELPTDSAVDVPASGTPGLLMIVDYADRWPHGDLLRLFADPLMHQGRPARVLLLGRSVQWWPAMRGELAELRATTGDLPLSQLAGTPQARAEVFDAARDRFAELLDVDQPGRIRPPGALDGASYGLVLALHMAALVAVDACDRGQRPPAEPEGLAAYLLDREHMNWRRLYSSRVHGQEFQTPPSVMARTVFTAVLTGPARHTAGTTVLKSLELEPSQRILTDHRVCYPPADRATVLEPLAPDRLAEDFLALILPGHNVSGYDPDPWAADAPATLLTRGADTKPPAHT
ncbi:MAG: ATP-binding protein, partial [Pseudonocardiaceae bacterium]